MIIATNRSLARLPYLKTFLADDPDAVIGWGRKLSGRRAIWIARLLRRPLMLLEDGFVRSFERGSPSISVIVDELGAYYDARHPSGMEQAIARGTDEAQAARARNLINAWCDGGISKYNHAPDHDGPLPDPYVLVADQSRGDLSISAGLSSEAAFSAMLEAALAENPEHVVVVKVHPDVLTHGRSSYFPHDMLNDPRIRLIGDGSHPVRLLRHAERVYVATSLIGFEALLWGKPVRCFGMPFYAGWGLTQDEVAPPDRRGSARIEDVVHAALVTQARYANPQNGTRWQAEEAIAYMARMRLERFGPPRAMREVAKA